MALRSADVGKCGRDEARLPIAAEQAVLYLLLCKYCGSYLQKINFSQITP